MKKENIKPFMYSLLIILLILSIAFIIFYKNAFINDNNNRFDNYENEIYKLYLKVDGYYSYENHLYKKIPDNIIYLPNKNMQINICKEIDSVGNCKNLTFSFVNNYKLAVVDNNYNVIEGNEQGRDICESSYLEIEYVDNINCDIEKNINELLLKNQIKKSIELNITDLPKFIRTETDMVCDNFGLINRIYCLNNLSKCVIKENDICEVY
jgi:hypothetical protein